MFFSFWDTAKPGCHLISKNVSHTSFPLSVAETKTGRSAIGEIPYVCHRHKVGNQNFAKLSRAPLRLLGRVLPVRPIVEVVKIDQLLFDRLFERHDASPV